MKGKNNIISQFVKSMLWRCKKRNVFPFYQLSLPLFFKGLLKKWRETVTGISRLSSTLVPPTLRESVPLSPHYYLQLWHSNQQTIGRRKLHFFRHFWYRYELKWTKSNRQLLVDWNIRYLTWALPFVEALHNLYCTFLLLFFHLQWLLIPLTLLKQKIRSFKSCPVLNLAASRFHKGQEVWGLFFSLWEKHVLLQLIWKEEKFPNWGYKLQPFVQQLQYNTSLQCKPSKEYNEVVRVSATWTKTYSLKA